MNKIGILTFHYSNNYGGVLQSYSLYNRLKNEGQDVEIIDFVPANYNSTMKNILQINKSDIKNISNLLKRIKIKLIYNKNITLKFNEFRKSNMKLSKRVNEDNIFNILGNYETIIVGSDQIWNPSQRVNAEYFLDFGNSFRGRKISYAADSTISEIDNSNIEKLRNSIGEFEVISVRNKHSYDFVKQLRDMEIPIVADPTILCDFNDLVGKVDINEKYILTYILGNEIEGSHKEALKKIKQTYGKLPVYSIVIPTMDFKLNNFADKIYYDLGPEEWLDMFRNASFVYTDSYHGVLFSLKYNKPFLAYYTEKLRATRFIDLGERYDINKYIINSVDDIENKKSLDKNIDFNGIKKIISNHKKKSLDFLNQVLEKK